MLLTAGLFKIATSAIHGMIINTKHSFTSSAICHHAECIPCKITESRKLQPVVSPPAGECRYTLVLQALCGIEFLAYATFTCIGSIFGYTHKERIIMRPPLTSSTRSSHAPARIALLLPAPARKCE